MAATMLHAATRPAVVRRAVAVRNASPMIPDVGNCSFRGMPVSFTARNLPNRSSKVVARAVPDPKDLSKKVDEVTEKVQGKVAEATAGLQDAATKLDLSKLVQYNFFAQVVLAISSWGIMFFTTHATLAAGAKIGPSTIILMLGTLLSGYSAFLSYGYFNSVKAGGSAVLAGWVRMKAFYDHLTFNFVGAAAAVVSLQAAVGSQVMRTVTSNALSAVHMGTPVAGSDLSLQFLTQAASNTLLAHIVSVVFLVLLLKKTTDAYKPLVEMAEKFKASMTAV